MAVTHNNLYQNNHSHGSYKSYIIGFALSILLTLIPYFIVVESLFTPVYIVVAIVSLGLLQLLVQLVFFLHLNSESKPRWNLMVFIFTVIIVALVVIGSLWIMYNLNYNMM